MKLFCCTMRSVLKFFCCLSLSIFLLTLYLYTPVQAVITLEPVTVSVTYVGSWSFSVSGGIKTLDDYIQKGFKYRVKDSMIWSTRIIGLKESFSAQINGTSGKTYEVRAYYMTKTDTVYSKTEIVTVNNNPTGTMTVAEITANSCKIKIEIKPNGNYIKKVTVQLTGVSTESPVSIATNFSDDLSIEHEFTGLLENTEYTVYLFMISGENTAVGGGNIHFTPKPTPTPTTQATSTSASQTSSEKSETSVSDTVSSQTSNSLSETSQIDSTTLETSSATNEQSEDLSNKDTSALSFWGNTTLLVILGIIALALVGITALLIVKMSKKK